MDDKVQGEVNLQKHNDFQQATFTENAVQKNACAKENGMWNSYFRLMITC